MMRLLGLVAGCLCVWSGLGLQRLCADDPPAWTVQVRGFLQTYCSRCHAAEEPKGDRRFDTLPERIVDDNALVDYQDILDQLNLGEMPPSDAKQPAVDERRQAIEFFTGAIDKYHEDRRSGTASSVLRRLNAREYRHTVRDLLHLNIQMFDPTTSFPADQTTEHLDNHGETLVTSGYLLARYLEAAEAVVRKALGTLQQPAVQTWHFTDNFRQQPEIDQVHRTTNGFKHLTLYDVTGADKHEGAYAAIADFASGVPHDGTYEIRFHAEAMNRDHPYEDRFLNRDRDEPLRLGIVAGNRQAGKLYVPQPLEPLLAELELADAPEWYSVRVHLDAGWTPRFTFRNGLMDARSLWTQIPRKYPQLFEDKRITGIVQGRFQSIKFGRVPHIRIYEVEIRGPFYEQWPTPAQRALLGDDFEQVAATGELDPQQVRQHVERLVTRAYRRPLADGELERLLNIYALRLASGSSSLAAYQETLMAALCSPNFIYRDVSTATALDTYALAERLSYFLWSSMPDAELTALAANGRLAERQVLIEQTRRMLRDPKAEAWIAGFLDSWLTLRDLGTMPPDRSRFGDFYQFDLQTAMRTETELFTQHLLQENLSIQHFLDADFTFVNRPLARLYGLEPPPGWGFAKVDVSDRRRGGLLGQASVLTVTANGIDTSPVVRGVWLLENILGTPPSPPPPDVEPLDPDIRGAVTIREQLAKHRSLASCLDCHRKIDPLGFALENFDPVGRWRDAYGRGVAIDASGELPNGQAFDDIQGLKHILLEQNRQFARALATKLLAYATGRHLTATDRPYIDQLVDELESRGSGLRDLLELVVTSDLFRAK